MFETNILFTSIACLIIAYMVGMIHGGKVVQVITGVNLKKEGTGNYGASNAMLVLGKKYGLIVLLVDIAKAFILLIISKYVLHQYDLSADIYYLYIYLLVIGLFLGHCFPVYMKFNGGKGTAILLMSIVMINPLYGFMGVGLFILLAILSNYLVVGLFVFYLYNLFIAWFVSESILIVGLLSILFIIGVSLHIENLKKIKNKTEPLFRKSFRKK